MDRTGLARQEKARQEKARQEKAGQASAGQASAGEASAGEASAGEEQAGPSAGRNGWRLPAARSAARSVAASPVGRSVAGRPVARHLVLLICYLAAGVAVTWPRATYLAGRLPSARDSASYVWGFWWVARQATHLSSPWSTGNMAAPVGIDLGFHALMPLPGLLMTPVTLAFGPSASYNLMVIAVPGLLCYAMYRAARLWIPSQTGAIAAGAFFGLSSMLTQQDWYHLNIAAGALFLPVALEASVRLRRRPGTRQAIILGLAVGFAMLTDPESLVLVIILTALVVLPWLLRQHSLQTLRAAAVATAAAALAAAPQIIAMLQELAVGGLAIRPALLAVTYKHYGVGLPGMFEPTPRVADFGLARLAAPFLQSKDNEGLPMFGVVLTAAALFGLATAWRRRSAWLLALTWAGCAALALGASLWIGMRQYIPFTQLWHGVRVSPIMPYTWFVRIPGLSSFREADRMAILGLVPAALLAGAAVDWLRRHARPLVVVVLALGILEAGYSGSPRIGSIPSALASLDGPVAADHSGSIVVDIPYGLRGGIPVYGSRFPTEALVLATADGHPRGIAYTSRVPATTIAAIGKHAFYAYLIHTQHYNTAHYTPLSAAQIAAARRDVRHLAVGWVLDWHSNPAIRRFLTQTGFRFDFSADGVLVYRPAFR
jgi:hypothetical protein